MDNPEQSRIAGLLTTFPSKRRLLLAVIICFGAFLFLLLASRQNDSRLGKGAQPAIRKSPMEEPFPPIDDFALNLETKRMLTAPQSPYSGRAGDSGLVSEPRIAYSAELSAVTHDFAHSRSSMEDILERHRGYAAKLRMVGEPGGSILSATLRVPSSEYRSALAELKTVGALEREEEAADEVAQQHGELEARLINAQNEEQRLIQLLQKDGNKTRDQLLVEQQLAALHSEIERVQAERSNYGAKTFFANVYFSLREERSTPAETLSAKLRNAATGGLSDAIESISSILLFLASHGPFLVLWAALLFFPGRFLWRKYQRTQSTGTASVA